MDWPRLTDCPLVRRSGHKFGDGYPGFVKRDEFGNEAQRKKGEKRRGGKIAATYMEGVKFKALGF